MPEEWNQKLDANPLASLATFVIYLYKLNLWFIRYIACVNSCNRAYLCGN